MRTQDSPRLMLALAVALAAVGSSSSASASVLFEVNVQADHRVWNTVLDSRTYTAAAESGNWSIDFDCVSGVHPHFDGQITTSGTFADNSLTFGSRTEYLWNPPGFNLGWPWLKTQYTISMWTTAAEGTAVAIQSRTVGTQVNQNLNSSFGHGPWYWNVGGYVYQAPFNQNMSFDESHVENGVVTGASQVFGSTLYRKIGVWAQGISEFEQNSSTSGGPHYGLIDASTTLSVNVVPEPMTLTAFGIGILALARRRSSRTRRKP